MAATAPPKPEHPQQLTERELEAYARLSDLLHELCPNGLTDDCPARKVNAADAR